MVVLVVLAGFGGTCMYSGHLNNHRVWWPYDCGFWGGGFPSDLLSTELVITIVVLGPHHRPQLLHIHPLPAGSGSAQQGTSEAVTKALKRPLEIKSTHIVPCSTGTDLPRALASSETASSSCGDLSLTTSLLASSATFSCLAATPCLAGDEEKLRFRTTSSVFGLAKE